MKLAFESPLTIPSIDKTLNILIDRARICLNDIHYHAASNIVEMLIQRKELIGFKKSFLGVTRPVYGQKMIDAKLTINEVFEAKIEFDNRLVAECNSCFTVLFGLNINDNNLYIGSVEEFQGKSLCQVFIKVKEISIECVDIERK
jgi:hypothetical protein